MRTSSARTRCIVVLAALAPTGCLSREIEAVLDAARACSSTGATDTTSTAGPETTGDTTETATSEGASSAADTTGSTTAETTTGTTGETTADAPAVCGNGVLEPLGPVPEECDDGNLVPDDGCDETCARDLRVFVSSSLHQGDIGGLGMADSICINRAGDADFPNPLRYRAWLSDSETDARDRIEPGRGRYVLPNGLVVADSWEALLAGELQRPIDATEALEVYDGKVWTGTRPDGTRVPDGFHCADWTSLVIADKGHFGYSDQTYPGWTLAQNAGNPTPCASMNALYCVEQLE